MTMGGLHRLAFEPKVQFMRERGGSGDWTCSVCEQVVAESEIPRHREQIHVVMVYPHGVPKPAYRERKAAV